MSDAMKEKISVAMAAFQGEKYISEQIESILMQLSEDDELIVSYDPSSDNTLKILRSFENRDRRIRIVLNNDHGVTGNFNNAIMHCSGDYIYISDQDDVWAPNKVEIIQRYFHDKNVDMVIHNGIHTNENLKVITPPFFEMYRIGNGLLKNIAKPRYSGCCMAFTRKMKNIILPIPEIRGYDQWIATVGEIFGIIGYPREILLYHRLHGENVTPLKSRPLPVILHMRFRLIAFLLARCIREVVHRRV